MKGDEGVGMNILVKKSWFDSICDAVLLIFLSVLIAYGPDARSVFIPTELLFVSVFGIRFLVKRSRLTLYTIWGIGLVFLAFLSISYATDQSMAFERALPVVQVIVFGNLIAPYVRDSERNYALFLKLFIVALLVFMIRILFSAPLELLLAYRLGPTVAVNANNLGLSFAVAGIFAIYFALVEKRFWYLVLFPLFMVFSLFSGSRKAIAVLGIGLIGIVFFSQKTMKRALLSLLIASFVAGCIVVLSLTWAPLYRVIGSRIETFLAFFTGGQTDGSTSIRFEMIAYGWNMFLQKPLFGWGLGAFTDVAGFGFYSHNNYIEILVSLGLVGFLWYYALPLGILIKGFTMFLQRRKRKSLILSMTIILVFLVDDIGRVRLYSEFSHILYAFCYVGIARQDDQAGIDLVTIFRKIVQWIRDPRLILVHVLKWRVCRLLPDSVFVSLKYWAVAKKKLNLKHPASYNEKIQWLKLNDRNPLYTQLVDKVAVRSYIKKSIGEQYLVPQIGVYRSVDEIRWDELPEQFVLKANHTSGDVLICTDSHSFDREKAIRQMQTWLQKNYYWYNREWPYKGVEPRIICEPYLVDESGYELKDYKIYVFHGEPKLIQVDFDRYTDHKRNIYTPEWEYVDVMFHYPTHPEIKIEKPKKLDEMLTLAKKLSAGMIHARIDFFVVEQKIYVGEITLYKGGGFAPFSPESFALAMGEWIHLPIEQ